MKPHVGAADAPGRMCPRDYRYHPGVFDRRAELQSDVLYVVGGLYGNLAALDAVEALAARETAPVTIVLNGDFHWFDADARWFKDVEARTAGHLRLRGNIETEVARGSDVGAGCGCAYPEDVSAAVVSRSNTMMRALRTAATPQSNQHLLELPMHLVAAVGTLRVGIGHGDAHSLAGWDFAHDRLSRPEAREALSRVQATSKLDVFASTHTCAAVLCDARGRGRITVVNNGAAGMPNFSGTQYGLLTRIATRPSPHPRLYGLTRDGVHIDAVAIHYDAEAFLRDFLNRWPAGSPAHASYFRRLVDGPEHSMGAAVLAVDAMAA